MAELTSAEKATARFFRRGLEQLLAKTLGYGYEIVSLTPGTVDTHVHGRVLLDGPTGRRELDVSGSVSHEAATYVRVQIEGLGEGLFTYDGLGPFQRLGEESYHTDLTASGHYARPAAGRYVDRAQFVQVAQERLIAPMPDPASAVEVRPQLGGLDEAPGLSGSSGVDVVDVER